MRTSVFPPPETSDHNGVLCFTDDIDCEMLIDAYYHGIFPWPYDEWSVLWAVPQMRGIIPIDKFHIPKSLKRELKKERFKITADMCFDDVIEACATIERSDCEGTWITPKVLRAFKEFHRMGYAHSFEAFNKDGDLVGGLYGVVIGKVFSGESMFFRESGASKIAFCKAVEAMKSAGITLIDTQMVTNLTAAFGAYFIPLEEHQKLLGELRDDKPTPGIFNFIN